MICRRLQSRLPSHLASAGFKRTIHQTSPAPSAAVQRECRVYDTFVAGHAHVDYERGWRWQRHLMESQGAVNKAGADGTDSLIVLQHPSTFTLGRGSTLDNLKFDLNPQCKHSVVRIERGGEVTWHGPGQLVVYPIFDLHFHKKDLRWWVTSLEEAVIQTLAHYGIQGQRDDINTGVWVGKSKICAIGVSASRWVTMHGLALNIACGMEGFQQIVPCGIAEPDRGVCTMAQFTDNATYDDVKHRLLHNIATTFGVQYVQASVEELDNAATAADASYRSGLTWLGSAPQV